MTRRFLSACLLAALLQTLSAATLYDQPPAWSGTGSVGSSWTSQVDDTLGGWRAFDNFTLASSATIDKASWYGIYLTPGTAAPGDLVNGDPNTATWVIRFYDDLAGFPGLNVLSTTSLTSAQVTSELAGAGTFNYAGNENEVSVYRFTADLNDFAATGGTQYWFSPLSRATNFYPLFSWIEGTGGDGSSSQWHFTAGQFDGGATRPGDRAFTLYGPDGSVPEPATLPLAAAGLAALSFIKRRLAS